jgi:hypothetical protein
MNQDSQIEVKPRSFKGWEFSRNEWPHAYPESPTPAQLVAILQHDVVELVSEQGAEMSYLRFLLN